MPLLKVVDCWLPIRIRQFQTEGKKYKLDNQTTDKPDGLYLLYPSFLSFLLSTKQLTSPT
ncbi:hypothetical protein [Fischerella thermalis]|jgi:hypothetical protein|uniref:hypothetical protein n=1 Tax=Fischerella thermalis TaxID=372787 RepID=UPI0002E108A0|nr:hypothetical protein [Fischerella thermalis]PLZ09803.1 hypothetical protein CBP17_13105 [Fischerella thermalis WC114]PLZ10838.1 hypothetical protein CBP18_09790 [Fischerella thermalis WC119]PLZ19356.1 hypothetical protein CBP30_13470 [Fischerella thermalis WC157]PLZ22135.1 hypothetical protein CBP29_14470 [Fischerella thermalis WC341]PLZ29270.1 hypothetical protein CBP28_10400 [Fischerella thermalis WC559]PLZ30956.1 hypothetical protein CBP10_12360 [Fischerella thermalis WC558]PLZ35858.1 